MRLPLALVLLLSAAPLAWAQPAPATAYVGGQWWTGERFEPRDTTWASGGAFVAGPLADAGRVVDLAGRFVIPPYGDAHQHMLDGPYSAQFADSLFRDPGVFYVLVITNPARSAQRVRGRFDGPGSIDVAYTHGGWTSTGSHPGPLYEGLYNRDGFDADAPRTDSAAWSQLGDAYWFVDAVEDVAPQWSRYLRDRPDAVKVYLADVAAGLAAGDVRGHGLSPDVLAEVVRLAHEAGLPVYAHVDTADDVRLALDAGVDGFAHLPSRRAGRPGAGAIWLDDGAVRQFVERGTVAVPTSSLLMQKRAGWGGILDPTRRDTLQAEVARQAAELRALNAAGVPIALGADRWMQTSRREADYLVGQGVFDAATVLDLWTRVTPQTVFPDRPIGRLADGFEASLLALACDPTEDWACTARIAHREKQGATIGADSLVTVAGRRAGDAAPATTALAITDVTLVPMDSARVVRDQTVVVEGGRIASIGPASAAAIPEGAHVVDGRGLFLLPGLADMHVHLAHPETDRFFADDNRQALALLLAHGVTTARVMWGSPGLLALRDSVARGDVLGPALTVASPFVDGRGPYDGASPFEDETWRYAAETPDAARAAVREVAAAGYDYVKAYSQLSAAAYRAVLDQAEVAGVPVVGHVPWAVGLGRVLTDPRQASVEHASAFAGLAEASDSPIRDSTAWWWRGFGPPAYADPERVDLLAQLAATSRLWFCPTLLTNEWYSAPQARTLARLGDPDLVRYTPAAQRAQWRGYAEGFAAGYAGWGVDMAAHRAFALDVARALHAAGARLLLGSDDTPALGVHGAAAHDELALWAEAGLSPFEALRLATANAQAFLREHGLGDARGTIAVGEPADLVLVRADPLADVANAREIEAVVTRGRLLDRSTLDAMLAAVEARYAGE